MSNYVTNGFADELQKCAGVMDALSAKADEATFSAGNRMAAQTAKRYVRGAMRKAGLNPDSKEDRMKAGLAVGGGGLAATALAGARDKAKRKKEMMAMIQKHEASKPSLGRVVKKVLSRGRK